MRRIAKSPSGPNPRRLAATGSSDGGVGSRFGRECRDVFRQIRGVACRALFRKCTQGPTRHETLSGQRLAELKLDACEIHRQPLFAGAHG